MCWWRALPQRQIDSRAGKSTAFTEAMSEAGGAAASLASDLVDFGRNAHAELGAGAGSAEKPQLGKPALSGGSSFSAPAARKLLY
jgi:hypothetical protein